MSIAQNPMTGEMKKSMANFSTYVFKGQNIVRSKVFTHKDANTELQKAQRASFKLIVNAYQALGGLADNGFPLRPVAQSPYNAFVAANLRDAIDNTGIYPVIDYRKMVVAQGSLPSVVVTSAVADAVGITVSYNAKFTIPRAATTDLVMLIAKLKGGEIMVASQPRGSEEESSLLLVAPNINKDDLDYLYLFVTKADRKNASNSVFVDVV